MISAMNYEIFAKNIENRCLTDICRFCLLDVSPSPRISFKTIQKLYRNVTDINLVEDTNLPSSICGTCENNLRIAAKIKSDIGNIEAFWKRFTDELPPIEEIKVEEIDDDGSYEIPFETVEMVIEPVYNDQVMQLDDAYVDDDYKGSIVDKHNSDCASNDSLDATELYLNECEIKGEAKIGKKSCDICEISNLTYRELKVHRRNYHGQQEIKSKHKYVCDICQKTYLNKYGLLAHIKRHVQNRSNTIQSLKRYTCSGCTKQFSKKSELQEHELIHSGLTPHICHICGVARKTRHAMNQHLKTHSADTSANKSPDGKPKSTKRYYTCWLCPKRIDFKTLEDLKTHRKNFHHKFQCEFCKNGFMTQEALQSHILIHRTQDRPHVCKYCGGTFSKLGHLNSHIQGKHALQKPHPCDKCPKGFVHRYQLQSHIRIFHDKIKAFKCPECPVSFGHAKSRVWHLRQVHKKNL